MKRLLEWKQRMLQSPLARKSHGRPTAAAAASGVAGVGVGSVVGSGSERDTPTPQSSLTGADSPPPPQSLAGVAPQRVVESAASETTGASHWFLVLSSLVWLFLFFQNWRRCEILASTNQQPARLGREPIN